jgi:hypothetical protein
VLATEYFPADPLVSLDPRLETFQTPGGSQAIKRREVVAASFRAQLAIAGDDAPARLQVLSSEGALTVLAGGSATLLRLCGSGFGRKLV